MSTITTRAGKGSPLTNNEVDANFTNLNTDKAELSGATFTGEITANGGIALGDNDKATFGASDDLQIYSDGTDGYIDNVTGDFYIRDTTGGTLHLQAKTGEEGIVIHDDGGVDLYRNNALKMSTTSTGIDVTGTATMDGLTVDGGAGNSLVNLTPSGTYSTVVSFANAASAFDIVSYGSGSASADNFRIRDNGASRLNIAGNGDISFYEDTGTTPKLFWDASAESLGIGTSSPSSSYAIDATAGYRSSSAIPNFTLVETDSSNQTWQINSTGAKLSFRDLSRAADRVVVDTSGNVGIGSSTANHFSTAGTTNVLGVKSTNGGLISIAATGTNFSGIDLGTDSIRRGGVYSLNGSNLGFYTNATNSGTALTERMRIDSSGNVGIGTSSLTSSSGYETLSINGTTGGQISFQTGGSGKHFIFSDSTDLNIYNSQAGNLKFFTDSSERLRIDSSGRVGIGTTSPSYKADILATNQYALRLNTTDADGCFLALQTNGTAKGYLGTSHHLATNSPSEDDITLRAENNLQFTTGGGTERMRIDSSGNVGIGTSSPSKTLTVGNTDATSWISSGGSNVHLTMSPNGAAGAFIVRTGGTNGDPSTTTERMRIDSSGNLLVGTTDTTIYSNSAGSTADNGMVYDAAASRLDVTRYTTSASSAVALFNKTGVDGSIVELRKDGTTVGSIGTNSNTIYIDGSSANTGLQFAGSTIAPRDAGSLNDGGVDLGTSSYRFKDLYLSGHANFATAYAATGIYLGAYATPNLLDDYEEGTWTPVISDGTNNATSSVAEGQYTKVGRQVTLSGRFTLSSLGSVSGSTRITGLPFAVSSGNAGRGSLNVSYAAAFNLTSGYTIIGSPAPSGSFIYLGVWDIGSGTTDLQASEMSAISTLFFSATYFV